MRKIFFLTAALAAISIQGAQDTARIQWKPKVGDTATLSTQVTMSMQGMNIEVMLRATSKVLDVSSETVKLEATEQMVDFKLNGESMMGQMPSETSKKTYTMRLDGEVVSYSIDGQGMDNPRLEEAFAFLYPNREVKTGEAWTRNRTANKEKGTVASKTTFTFLGAETIEGASAYKVKMSFAELEGATPMTFDATVWISPENGDMLKMDGMLRNVQFDPSMPPADAAIKVTRVR